MNGDSTIVAPLQLSVLMPSTEQIFFLTSKERIKQSWKAKDGACFVSKPHTCLLFLNSLPNPNSSLNTIFDLFMTRLDTPKQVQRGDIVIFEGLNGLTAGVFWNNQIWAKGDKGVFMFDMKDSIVVDVWRY